VNSSYVQVNQSPNQHPKGSEEFESEEGIEDCESEVKSTCLEDKSTIRGAHVSVRSKHAVPRGLRTFRLRVDRLKGERMG
jgi:hypothetical protein